MAVRRPCGHLTHSDPEPKNYFSPTLCGAMGQFMGNRPVWLFDPGWQAALSSTGAPDMARWGELFRSRPWHELVPDEKHEVVIDGPGDFRGLHYLAAARAADGSLVMAYMPAARTITVDMSKVAGKRANPVSTRARVRGIPPEILLQRGSGNSLPRGKVTGCWCWNRSSKVASTYAAFFPPVVNFSHGLAKRLGEGIRRARGWKISEPSRTGDQMLGQPSGAGAGYLRVSDIASRWMGNFREADFRIACRKRCRTYAGPGADVRVSGVLLDASDYRGDLTWSNLLIFGLQDWRSATGPAVCLYSALAP